MPATNGKLYKKHLSEQAAVYLVTGILISISHHLHNYAAVIFFGHLLIAVSFLILLSTMLNYKWMRRIAGPLDIFSGTTLIIAFAVDFVIFTIDELVYYEHDLTP
jgi:type II secretory pathway component PulF